MSDSQKRNPKSTPQLSAIGNGLLKEFPQRPRCRSNLVGPMIAKLRYQRGWKQDDLVAKLQILGCDLTRDVVANIETRRSPVTDTQIDFFCRVFGVAVQELFPPPCRQGRGAAHGVMTSFVPSRPCHLNNDHPSDG